MKANYHTHSEYCGHASGTPEDYVKKAIEYGFEALGYSEHGPFPGDPFGTRMDFNQLPDYINNIHALQKKYAGQIDIPLGLEIEYLPAYVSFLPILFERYKIEYLIMGQHFFMGNDLRCYNLFLDSLSSDQLPGHVEIMLEGMQTGFFKYIAHPDLMFLNDLGMDKNCLDAIDLLVKEANNHHYMLELNANGFRRGKSQFLEGVRYPYPVDALWDKVGQTDIPVIIGSDCHNPNLVYDEAVKYAEEYAKQKHLNIVEKLEL